MRYFLMLNFLFCSFVLNSQSLTHEDFDGFSDLERYYHGALRIAQAEMAPSEYKNLLYEEAIDSLKPILMDSVYVNRYKQAQYYSSQPIVANDMLFQYSYDYAYKKYNDISIKPKTILRETPLKDNPASPSCRVLNFILEPCSSITFEDIMYEGTSIVIAMVQPGSPLSFTVKNTAGKTIQTRSFENGLISFCKWISNTEEEMQYIIENPTDKVVSFIIMSN